MEIHTALPTQPSHHIDINPHHHEHPPRSKRRVIGKYYLGKTVGKGSMGKVKIAIDSVNHKQVAVKMVSRRMQSNQIHLLSSPEASAKQEKERAAFISREIRTIREANIMLLLDHPNIAQVYELMLLENYYYLFMEYVDGGQLLDYIISHGKLKEKQARDFSRQIASALDYCHRNSIVHRDLKVENILLSRTGVIKLIDFGLSNVFCPTSHLSTFCGSLYFAAPELLDGRLYTGPEVDVWSFGVVIYVLVCGTVPFDDPNMSGMHAKVKKGHVHYPSHLSSDCKNLLQHLLVVDPSRRATMSDIIIHPWMVKGYERPIENHLPKRKPLQLPIDMNIVHQMRGFEFGTEEEIKKELEYLISREEYQTAAQNVEILSQHPFFNLSEGHYPASILKRRSFTYAMNDPQSMPAAYHPLISIYHLVKERMERDQAYARYSAHSSSSSSPITPMDPAFYDKPHTKDVDTSNRRMSPPIGFSYTVDGKIEIRNPTHADEDTVKKSVSETLTPKTSTEFKKGHGRKKSDSSFSAMKENVFRRFNKRLSRQGDDLNVITQPTSPQVADEPTTPVVTVNGTPVSEHPPSLATSDITLKPTNDKTGFNLNRFLKRSTSITVKDLPSIATSQSNEEYDRPRRSSVHDPNIVKKVVKNTSNDGFLAIPLSPATPIEDHHTNNEDTLSFKTTSDHSRTSSGHADESIKFVYLKGLFSVSNTSTKKPSAIRAEIIRVLEQKQDIQYVESKDKFQCYIKTKKSSNPPEAGHDFYELSDDESDTSRKSIDPNAVRFDIYIVKIPWLLGMRGLQFRRISGDPWQYKNTCRRILDGLRL